MPEEVEPATVLPPATQTGANTAGCRLNGALWDARQYALFAPEPTSASWHRSPLLAGKHQLSLRFIHSTNAKDAHNDTSIGFFVPDVSAPGTFVLDRPANPRFSARNPAYGVLAFDRATPGQELLSGPQAPGRLVITRLDTVARVVSGTFEFTARQAGATATSTVTEGRFDCTF